MVQRYEQTRKLQWYKRGAAYLILQVALAKMENLDIAWKNSSYSQGCVWNNHGHQDNERLNPLTVAL